MVAFEKGGIRPQRRLPNGRYDFFPYAPVGATVYNAYWRECYTVLRHNADGSVWVEWHGKDDSTGLDRFPRRDGTHRTPLDKRDTVISCP